MIIVVPVYQLYHSYWIGVVYVVMRQLQSEISLLQLDIPQYSYQKFEKYYVKVVLYWYTVSLGKGLALVFGGK